MIFVQIFDIVLLPLRRKDKYPCFIAFTVQSLYNTPRYNTDLDITCSCGYVHVALNIFTMKFYKGVIGK